MIAPRSADSWRERPRLAVQPGEDRRRVEGGREVAGLVGAAVLRVLLEPPLIVRLGAVQSPVPEPGPPQDGPRKTGDADQGRHGAGAARGARPGPGLLRRPRRLAEEGLPPGPAVGGAVPRAGRAAAAGRGRPTKRRLAARAAPGGRPTGRGIADGGRKAAEEARGRSARRPRPGRAGGARTAEESGAPSPRDAGTGGRRSRREDLARPEAAEDAHPARARTAGRRRGRRGNPSQAGPGMSPPRLGPGTSSRAGHRRSRGGPEWARRGRGSAGAGDPVHGPPKAIPTQTTGTATRTSIR